MTGFEHISSVPFCCSLQRHRGREQDTQGQGSRRFHPGHRLWASPECQPTTITGSNIPTKAVEVSWWFAAAALTATPGPVPLLLNFPEDFGGDSVTGPTSIWALAGSAHFKAWWKPGEKQQTSALSPGRVNVVLWACSPTLQHLMNSYDGWPHLHEQQGRLHYLGPLPQNCPCVSQHQPSKCLSVEGFHLGSQPLLTTIFWTRVFRALPSQPGPVALKDGSTLLSTGPSSLCSLLQSAPSLPVGSFPGSLDPLFRAWSQGSLTQGTHPRLL